MLYLFLKYIHSGIRWIALVMVVFAIVNSIIKSGKLYKPTDRILYNSTIIIFHLQLVIGLLLYFISPKVIFSAESMSNKMLRFFLVEHSSLMLIAIIIATIGNSVSKKAENNSIKHRRITIFFGISLLIILLAIPWPWQDYASAWF